MFWTDEFDSRKTNLLVFLKACLDVRHSDVIWLALQLHHLVAQLVTVHQ